MLACALRAVASFHKATLPCPNEVPDAHRPIPCPLDHLYGWVSYDVTLVACLQEPRCGFSRKISELLKDKGIEFSYFNILADEEVRQGLKEFSDWPTFPQLYISGDLVGGLDIVKEMAESGELEAAIPKPEDLNKRLEELINRDKIMAFIKGRVG